MPEKEYVVDIDLDVRMRCWHKTARGQLIAFTVQLEVLTEDRWQPVVRYDTAHSYAHRDLYRKKGPQLKTPLGMDFKTARTFAQDDVLKNWMRYKQLFLEE